MYIGGYGHSGSTLLEYLLAASPEIVACGEVSSVLRERGRQRPLTAGAMNVSPLRSSKSAEAHTPP
jgi:hypothetical protein